MTTRTGHCGQANIKGATWEAGERDGLGAGEPVVGWAGKWVREVVWQDTF